jgi:hypothetical protein
MPKKRQGGKTRGRKRERKRPVKDLVAKRGGDVRGGTGAGKLTFGAPSPRPASGDPGDPSGRPY